MNGLAALLLSLPAVASDPLAPGDHARSVQVGGAARPYRLHVPEGYDPGRPTPVVLALHPFATDGATMARISGLAESADREGFLVAFPEGTGRARALRWNVGEAAEPDDVAYLAAVLDDIESAASVDRRRIYAAGFSNGGMMAYRLASRLSGRIAAIASVGGTMPAGPILAERPVPVLHLHGTADRFVTPDGRVWREPRSGRFLSVDETARAWARHNGCPEEPARSLRPAEGVGALPIRGATYGPGRAGAEVVVYLIEGGGHTWPGRDSMARLFGPTAMNLDANALIRDFFRSHPMP